MENRAYLANIENSIKKVPYFWQAWSACRPETWKMDADEEFRRISKMPRAELLEYIKVIVNGLPGMNLRRQFWDLANKSFDDGRRAQDVFLSTLKSIFDLLQSRLVETDHDLDVLGNDIKNIEIVMSGNITSSDYTVLFLVHQKLVKKEKRLATMAKDKIPENRKLPENRKYCRMLLGFMHQVERAIEHKLPQ